MRRLDLKLTFTSQTKAWIPVLQFIPKYISRCQPTGEYHQHKHETMKIKMFGGIHHLFTEAIFKPEKSSCPSLVFPVSRGLSRRGKMKREERDLCRLPTSCLMKPPTKFLVETYRISKPVSFNVQCACLVRLNADNYRAHVRICLPRVSKFLTLVEP